MDTTEILDDIRYSIAEDLAQLGKALGELRNEIAEELIDKLLPPYKRSRFRRAVAEARTGILKAMDCLMPNESPSTEAVLEQLIMRWEKAHPKEKDMILATLREAFKPQKEIPYGTNHDGAGKANGPAAKPQAAKP